MKITSLEGIRARFDGGGMFGHAPKAMWSKWYPADESNRVDTACRNLLIMDSDLVILCDAAGGSYMDERSAERFGITDENMPLQVQLREHGVSEDDVDFIFLSHLHFDHTGGIIPDWPAVSSPDWKPLFPNARYVVSREQYERSAQPHQKDRASYVPGLPEKIKESGRLILAGTDIDLQDQLPPFVELFFSDGHTPGLMHPCITCGNRKVFFCSDLIPGTPWLHLPIISSYDRFPELTVDEKEKILDQAVKENWLLVYPHDPLIAASEVTINNKGRYEAANPMPTLELNC